MNNFVTEDASVIKERVAGEVWRKWEYRLDVFRVTCGVHIECI
jgi:hypothetical protein